MIKNPRHIALNILLLCHKKNKTLDQSLDSYDKEISSLGKPDRNLCNALVFGVLRQRGCLDFYIRAFSKIDFQKINEKVLNLLRIGLFQTIYMDRIPVSAAVNTSVSITKLLFDQKTSGFVNAVLRNACENYSKIKIPDSQKDPLRHLSIKYSLPPWLTKRWLHHYGFDQTRNLLKKINTPPAITIRTNLLKINREALADQLKNISQNIILTKYCKTGISFSNPQIPINEFEGFKTGLFQIQDEAAQLIGQILAPKPGEKVLDACAGLGGKTGHIAQLMENTGHLFAMDVDSRKLGRLNSEASRLGIKIIQTKTANILKTSIKDFPFFFDRVLLDAPCSGLGVLRRNPDSKWKRSKTDILRLAGKQKKMLNAAANLTAPGGVLVFAVCSCEKEENEDVVVSFLSKRKDFVIDDTFVKTRETLLPFITAQGFFKTYPKVEEMDGFFAARFKRKPK